MLDDVFERFAEQGPVAVMARLGLQRALSADWVDEVFEQNRRTQYTRELLFSTVVDLMSLVALGLRPSLHAAAQKARDLPVSLAALYDKVNHVEPAVLRALVRGSAERLAPVMAPLRKGAAPWLRGYRVRIVDGNHLPASEKRLAPLRGRRGAALPGHSLVVFDPDAGLGTDVVPCEDGHASERGPWAARLAAAEPGELWLGDRNFCTRASLRLAHARGAALLVREHGANARPTPAGPRRKVGRVETGVVYEQPVTIPLDDEDEGGERLPFRRVELELDTPTEGGDTTVRLLTTLPADVTAKTVARLYRKRWTIEGLFGRLEATLRSEVRTLGYPRAALFAFALAVLAYNVLCVIEAAIAAAHDLEAEGVEVSTYYVADDVRAHYLGMLVAVPATWWAATFDALSPAGLARTLRRLAAHVDPKTLRKHPRGPKKSQPKGYAPRAAVEQPVFCAGALSHDTLRGVRLRPAAAARPFAARARLVRAGGACGRPRAGPPHERGRAFDRRPGDPRGLAVVPRPLPPAAQAEWGGGLRPSRPRSFDAYPALFTCRARPIASASAGTSSVTVVPVPTYAPSPTLTGATSCESDPMNARAPIVVRCFLNPS